MATSPELVALAVSCPVLLPLVNNVAYRASARLVGTLAGLGLRHAALSPGSRSTPLSLAFLEHPAISTWVHHDERSGSFFALGLAKQTGRPVAVVTTSGTAAAELCPAAVEARFGLVPLLLLTADRPPELRGVGAPQTIDQPGMFAKAVLRSEDVMLTDLSDMAIEALAREVWADSWDQPPGPVHLNLGFREPFVPEDLTLPPVQVAPRPPRQLPPDPRDLKRVDEMLGGRRVVAFAGPTDDPAFPKAITALALRAGWPILADPLSGLRAGEHDRSRVISTGDAIVRIEAMPADPEVIIRFGAPMTSKALNRWQANHPHTPCIVVDVAEGRDPAGTAATMIQADLALAADALDPAPAPPEWAEAWIRTDQMVRAALEDAPFPSEPAIVQAVAETIPGGANLVVASSLPIRDVDLFFPKVDRPVRILSNRGANGIDGTISSGLGAAAGGTPTVILTGDLALLHDVGALATAARSKLPVTILAVNNDGGGIFSFLPQRELPRHFETLFTTPHGLSFVPVARAFGMSATEASNRADLERQLRSQEHSLIEVRTDRAHHVEIVERLLATARRRLR